MMNYQEFLNRKSQLGNDSGFEPVFMPDFLFDFQKALLTWATKKGRAAIFADCGLGKTPMQLVWAENVIRKTNGRVLILTPLAVSYQTIEEARKFDIEAYRTNNGELHQGINITNYERLKYYQPSDFQGVVCDESSILKSFDGSYRNAITDFMKKIPYRLLATATAAPNDYIELGSSSEVLGELGYMDMLNRFFKNDQSNSKIGRYRGETLKWRFKKHAETPFWKWICSWARAMRKPSDLGFEDKDFILPELSEKLHQVKCKSKSNGMLFEMPAHGWREQREEKRRSIEERCEKVAELISHNKSQSLIWCHLNAEGDLLERLIPESVQVSGSDSDEKKERNLLAFAQRQIKVLITKPKIGAFGLNFQNCSHITYFPSHSYEQYYQAVRRCWRFGQKNPVIVDIVLTEGEKTIMANLLRKSKQAEKMFIALIEEMNNAISIHKDSKFNIKEELPSWL